MTPDNSPCFDCRLCGFETPDTSTLFDLHSFIHVMRRQFCDRELSRVAESAVQLELGAAHAWLQKHRRSTAFPHTEAHTREQRNQLTNRAGVA